MSWHCSRALAAEFSQVRFAGGEPSARSKSTNTAVVCSCNDKMTECCHHSQFGMTCDRLTAIRGAKRWMSSLAGFLANRSVLPASKSGQATNATCGQTQSELFAKFDQNLRCWKTCLVSCTGKANKSNGIPSNALCLGEFGQATIRLSDLTPISPQFWVTWPKAGLMSGGVCYRRPNWERRINVIDCGYSRMYPTPYGLSANQGQGYGEFAKAIRHWPTPIARDARSLKGASPKPGRQGSPTFVEQVSRQQFATPTSGISKGGKPKNSKGKRDLRLDTDGGALNPAWVEWLMGWPIGWTDLEPLETGKFQSWQRSFGGYF